MSYDGTIEVGKFYATRAGWKVRIYAVESNCIHGAVLHCARIWRIQCWNPGGWFSGPGEESPHDIVGLWVDLPKPKWRPFTTEELTRIVGRRVRLKDDPDYVTLVYSVNRHGHLRIGIHESPPSELLSRWEFLDFDADGNEVVTPCGVLEKGGE